MSQSRKVGLYDMDTYKRALVLTNNIAEPVYATVVVKPGETITDFGNLVFFTTGGHALSSGFSNTLRWNYTPDVVDLNVVEDGRYAAGQLYR